MVETNWGGGQSLCVFLKSCVSLEVEGEVAVAQASSGLMGAMAASLCLPAGHDAKLNGCSSCPTCFSQDKFLHPSTWLNQQKSVCAWRGPLVSPAAALADAEAAFGVHISLAVPGLFYTGCLSWACILPVLMWTELCFLSPFPSVRALEGRMASEICKSFSCTSPGAQRCSNVSICPPTAHDGFCLC